MAITYCEVYIRGVVLQGLGWTDDPDSLLDEIADNLNDIERLNFISISLNMNKAYNYHLKTSSYHSMLLYIKGIRYMGKAEMTVDELTELESKIKLYLGYVYGLSTNEFEWRLTQKMEYKELEAS